MFLLWPGGIHICGSPVCKAWGEMQFIYLPWRQCSCSYALPLFNIDACSYIVAQASSTFAPCHFHSLVCGQTSGPMSSADARIKSLQDAAFLDLLIKTHLKEEPGKCTELWKTDDIEEVVEHFNVFLCSVAGKGVRLSKSFFLGRLKRYFKSDHVTLEDFAGKLSQALRYCHGKGKKCTTGKKTSTPCLKVVAAYGFSHSSRAASPPTSKESLELPTAFSDDEAGPTDAKTEMEAVEIW